MTGFVDLNGKVPLILAMLVCMSSLNVNLRVEHTKKFHNLGSILNRHFVCVHTSYKNGEGSE